MIAMSMYCTEVVLTLKTIHEIYRKGAFIFVMAAHAGFALQGWQE